MKLDIMTEANKQLQTIEIFFNNALKTKIGTHKKVRKCQQQQRQELLKKFQLY